jgi:hypothetical protein
VELGREELKTLIGKTKNELAELDDEEKEGEEDKEGEENEDDEKMEDSDANPDADEEIGDTEDDKIAKEYGLDDYDDGILYDYSRNHDQNWIQTFVYR